MALSDVRVLIVDDSAHMRTIVQALLRAIGFHHIREASDGADAFDQLRTFVADVIIIDQKMDPIDGLEFTHMVRTAPDSPCPQVPIIMLTAHTSVGIIKAARDTGVDEFLAKPISAKMLLERLEHVSTHQRTFVAGNSYKGPDRRRRRTQQYNGPQRRDEKAG